MKLTHMLSAAALTVAFAGGLVATPAFADTPKGPEKISAMDTNKDGRIEKEEYLKFMGDAFDKWAGAKGHCTFEEVSTGVRSMGVEYGP